MNESFITESVCKQLLLDGYSVATEVANFHRSADIAAIGPRGEVLVVECKLSDIKHALVQTATHQVSADLVMVATYRRELRPLTISQIKEKGVGLFLVDISGKVELAWPPKSCEATWPLRREQLRKRILEEQVK
jgi:hypothetical protein